MFQVKNAIKFNTIFNILSYQRGIDFVDTTRSTGMYFPFQDWFDVERTAVDCLNSGCEGRRKKNCSFYFRSRGGGTVHQNRGHGGQFRFWPHSSFWAQFVFLRPGQKFQCVLLKGYHCRQNGGWTKSRDYLFISNITFVCNKFISFLILFEKCYIFLNYFSHTYIFFHINLHSALLFWQVCFSAIYWQKYLPISHMDLDLNIFHLVFAVITFLILALRVLIIAK